MKQLDALIKRNKPRVSLMFCCKKSEKCIHNKIIMIATSVLACLIFIYINMCPVAKYLSDYILLCHF